MSKHFPYACTAGVKGGRARCRNAEGNCPIHDGKRVSPAPRPTTVLVKADLTPAQADALERQGVKVYRPDTQRAAERAAHHAGVAESLGRNPQAVRPGVVDSGSPVFGRGGLKFVTLAGIFDELAAAGFSAVGVSLKPRGPKPTQLVLSLRKGAKDGSAVSPDIRQFFAGTFNTVHVWANPVDDGKVPHTVNCTSTAKEGKTTEFRLVFANGDWDAVAI